MLFKEFFNLLIHISRTKPPRLFRHVIIMKFINFIIRDINPCTFVWESHCQLFIRNVTGFFTRWSNMKTVPLPLSDGKLFSII